MEIQHRRIMKVKGRLNKLGNFNSMNVPCSTVEFSDLRDGKEVNLKDEVAEKMLAMGIVNKVNTKKTKKEKRSK
tara:strand:+ start:336 stop:557 length:222 start_codon:yes stop_codon:yes gene_type:complete